MAADHKLWKSGCAINRMILILKFWNPKTIFHKMSLGVESIERQLYLQATLTAQKGNLLAPGYTFPPFSRVSVHLKRNFVTCNIMAKMFISDLK